MKKLKQLLFILILLFSVPLTIQAIDTDEVKKVNFSEITGDDETSVSYNSSASRIEVNHGASSSLYNTYLTISDYSAAIPYQLVSFTLTNNMDSTLDFSVELQSDTTHNLVENQSVLLEGDKLYVSYVNNGTFSVPKNFDGRIYVPLPFTNERIQRLVLSSKNTKDNVSYYSSAFRVMNLSENEFIQDCIASVNTSNQAQISTSLADKYELSFIESDVIDEKGELLITNKRGIREFSMKIKDRDNFEIITKIDLSKLPASEKKKLVVEESEAITTVPTIEMKDGFVLASSVNSRILPLTNDIKEVVNKNSIVLSAAFPIGMYLLYLIAFALAVWGIIYLIKPFFSHDE